MIGPKKRKKKRKKKKRRKKKILLKQAALGGSSDDCDCDGGCCGMRCLSKGDRSATGVKETFVIWHISHTCVG